MTTLAYLLAVAAVLLTAAIYSFAHTPGPRIGPDAAGLEWFYLLACSVRWAIVALLLGVASRVTGLAGSGRRVGLAMAVLLGLQVVGGILSISSFMGLRMGGTNAELGTWIFGYAFPVALSLYAVAALQWRGESPGGLLWQRIALVIMALVTLAGSAVGLRNYSPHGAETAGRERLLVEEKSATEKKDRENRDTRDHARGEELERLPITEPLVVWLRFFATCDGAVREATAQKILSRSRFSEELGELLQTEHRVLALQFFWWHLPHPPQALAAPFQACLDSMPAWTEKTFSIINDEHATEVNWACEAIVITAGRFGNTPDFRPAIARLSAFIEERYAFDGFRSRGLLKGWLEREGVRPPSVSTR